MSIKTEMENNNNIQIRRYMIDNNYNSVYNHLYDDWGKIRGVFPKLPVFEEAVELYFDYNTISSNGYSLIIQNDSLMIRWESDFGKISCNRFNSFAELEMFLFSEPINRFLDRELQNFSLENIYLGNVIRGNSKYAMWSSVSTKLAKRIIDMLNFTLRVSLIQLTNGKNASSEYDKNKYIFCANTDYEFEIIENNKEFIVIFKGYRYFIKANK